MDDTPVAGETRAPALFRYRFANADFDESQGVLTLDGAVIPVEPRPLRLLLELLRHANEVVTKEELFDAVWDGRATVDNVLANAVNKLRKALGDEAGARIVNLPRVGYRLLGPVERVVVGRIDAARLDLQVGQPVPRRDGFRLERQLGSGGRGQVWLARHAKLDQLHVFKFTTDADGLRSLKREFTLYRVLKAELGDRPGFARLLDANFSEPPFFLECEDGGSDLLAWASEDEHLKLQPLQERLELFVKIAEAVAAAHGVGVLHKDLKPSNVLVSGGPNHWVPVLTDFGSGLALDAHRLKDLGLTAMGLTVSQAASADDGSGTPLYLAPEVVGGQASTVQSDVYALGLMLFQMVVGDLRRPLSTGWQREIADDFLCQDITAATEGDPKARLGSVSELVERLRGLPQRRLDQQQRAEQQRLAELAMAEAQRRHSRRPWVVAAAGSLVLGLAASLGLYLRAESALQMASSEARRARAINEFLNKDVLQSVDLARSNERTMSMHDLLRRASTRAEERFKGQPRTEASVHRQLGESHLRNMFSIAAESEFKTAIALLEPQVPAADPELLMSRFGLAQALALNYRAKEAETIVQLAERQAGPAVLDLPGELAVVALRAKVDVMGALQQHKQALPIAVRLVAAVDRWPEAGLGDRFEARQRLGEIHAGMGNFDQANAALAEITALPYSVQGLGETMFARARLAQARALIAQEKPSEAMPILIGLRDTMTRSLGPESVMLGLINFYLGTAYSLAGDVDKSISSFRTAYAAFSVSLGEQHAFTMSTAANLAFIEVGNGRSASGLLLLEKIAPWFKAHGAGLDGVNFHRAVASIDLKRFAEALALLDGIDVERFLVEMQEQAGQRWTIQAERGMAIKGLGRRQEGEGLIRTALVEMGNAGAPAELTVRYAKQLSK